jgi:hypothetical protein
MHKVRWAVPGLAVVAMTAAGVWNMRSEAPERDAPPPVATESRAGTPADLEQELRALRAELDSLRREQGRLARQGEPVAPQQVLVEEARPAAPGPLLPGAPEWATMEEARRERALELEAELEVAVNTEARDREWAASTEALVTGAFRGPELAGSRLARVECRTRLCVLEVEHDGQEARAELLTSLSRVPGLRGQAVLRPAGDGTRLASRVYLSRPGERLPLTARR